MTTPTTATSQAQVPLRDTVLGRQPTTVQQPEQKASSAPLGQTTGDSRGTITTNNISNFNPPNDVNKPFIELKVFSGKQTIISLKNIQDKFKEKNPSLSNNSYTLKIEGMEGITIDENENLVISENNNLTNIPITFVDNLNSRNIIKAEIQIKVIDNPISQNKVEDNYSGALSTLTSLKQGIINKEDLLTLIRNGIGDNALGNLILASFELGDKDKNFDLTRELLLEVFNNDKYVELKPSATLAGAILMLENGRSPEGLSRKEIALLSKYTEILHKAPSLKNGFTHWASWSNAPDMFAGIPVLSKSISIQDINEYAKNGDDKQLGAWLSNGAFGIVAGAITWNSAAAAIGTTAVAAIGTTAAWFIAVPVALVGGGLLIKSAMDKWKSNELWKKLTNSTLQESVKNYLQKASGENSIMSQNPNSPNASSGGESSENNNSYDSSLADI